MRIKFALAASLFAVSLAGAAFAQPGYSDDYTNDSDGFSPSPVSKPAPVHYSNRKAAAYSSDYTNDSDGFAPSAMAAPAVDKTATASIAPLPPCHSMIGPKGSHTKGADSGASRTEACRATH
ncbi:hypothetical protein [Rhizobium hidalgonense]|uniref:Uncharacterized protein n=1 Tax=Rhizobium hidalgonense TaxID=1538159 RepID=A0A2A6KH00_9HYPH|nr:hypothetical protein [Rhizobium hidalgonense]MDR9771238.1 hypothetical protein [Rhizobium hidalgonense]MDR9803714.1 hypothetical protein [Rhizobium hidalgonense]MDR9809207.1 hypothetical protein [Rhizobium hidalgonense]MDR9818732.1 hypothetical protein [Rhizobium hidalgonense]PDT23953.1 hypothetical protein CO674_07520 [Rhizobium hidalgonense]